MNQIKLKLLFGLGLMSLWSCELSSTSENENSLLLKLENNKEQVEFQDEDVLIGEIYSVKSIEAEMQAMDEGFEPEFGVEERQLTLELYSQYADKGSFLAFRFPRPTRPGGFPMPVCPPKTDCKSDLDQIDLNEFAFSFYSENPEMTEAIVETEEGVFAELANVTYNEEFRKATIRFQVINSELSELPTSMRVSTVVTCSGDQIIEELKAEIAEGVFQ